MCGCDWAFFRQWSDEPGVTTGLVTLSPFASAVNRGMLVPPMVSVFDDDTSVPAKTNTSYDKTSIV